MEIYTQVREDRIRKGKNEWGERWVRDKKT
jgi:hypothetical protein